MDEDVGVGVGVGACPVGGWVSVCEDRVLILKETSIIIFQPTKNTQQKRYHRITTAAPVKTY